jgi:hypothetical protein
METVKHLAGEYENGVQRCIICGYTICDYRNTMSPGTPAPQGFPTGPVFITDGNPMMLSTEIADGEPYSYCTIVRCIDDSQRPDEIPVTKWVKAGEAYSVVGWQRSITQDCWFFILKEIDLTGCGMYKGFSTDRFEIL